MPDLAAVLLGNCEMQEADMDCRRLSGNYVQEGIEEHTAQQLQPREKGATLATDTEMGRVANVLVAHHVKYTVPRLQQSLCLAISCDCAGAGCDKCASLTMCTYMVFTLDELMCSSSD